MTDIVRANKWDYRFIDMCFLVSSWSKDPSTKCGSVIVRDTNKVVCLGYNGYPSRIEDSTESLNNRQEKYEKILHAEVNAVLQAKQDLTGCTLYVCPLPPCSRCMAVIIQSGITRVVSIEPSNEALARWGDNFKLSSTMASDAGVVLQLLHNPYPKEKFGLFNQIYSLLNK